MAENFISDLNPFRELISSGLPLNQAKDENEGRIFFSTGNITVNLIPYVLPLFILAYIVFRTGLFSTLFAGSFDSMLGMASGLNFSAGGSAGYGAPPAPSYGAPAPSYNAPAPAPAPSYNSAPAPSYNSFAKSRKEESSVYPQLVELQHQLEHQLGKRVELSSLLAGAEALYQRQGLAVQHR